MQEAIKKYGDGIKVLIESNMPFRHVELEKRRFSAILIVCIYSTQLAIAAILNHFYLIAQHPLFWTSLYYIISFFAAVPQAGFSDETGRKKHLLIASSCVLSAVIWLFSVDMFKKLSPNLWPSITSLISIFPVCLLLGLLGNVIPIARGCLAALKLHDFQAAIGLTTSAIGLGWITVDFLTLALGPVGTLFFSIALQTVVIICIKVLYLFKEDQSSHKKAIIRKSYKWLLTMLFVTGGAAALVAYLLTEATFYQIYTLDELPTNPIGKKIIGSLMGIGYSVGVLMLWIVKPSSKNSIKFGLSFSIFCLLFLIFTNYLFSENRLRLEAIYSLRINGIAQFCFALGFGFFVPALFALMSNHIHPRHFGRLFGAVDSTDTAALYFSSFLLNIKTKLNFSNQQVYPVLLVLFSLSLILYRKVIRLFKSYEKD